MAVCRGASLSPAQRWDKEEREEKRGFIHQRRFTRSLAKACAADDRIKAAALIAQGGLFFFSKVAVIRGVHAPRHSAGEMRKKRRTGLSINSVHALLGDKQHNGADNQNGAQNMQKYRLSGT